MHSQNISTSNGPTTKYNVRFSGKTIETTVTTKASDIVEWVNDIQSIHSGKRIILGLDCEWRCPDHWGFNTKVATLQLCVGTKCLILQMAYMDSFPQSLKSFLNNPRVTCVGVQVKDAASRINREYGLKCYNAVDIRETALSRPRLLPVYYKPQLGLKDLAWHIVGLRMEKPRHVSKSDWQKRVLSEEQFSYGWIDAYCSYKIGHKLLVGN